MAEKMGQIGEGKVDMTLVGWRIFYGDGTELKGRTHDSFYLAPSEDVQVVIVYHAGQRRTYSRAGEIVTRHYKTRELGFDWYWLNPDGTLGKGNTSQVPEGLPVGAVKEGRWMELRAYKELRRTAFNREANP